MADMGQTTRSNKAPNLVYFSKRIERCPLYLCMAWWIVSPWINHSHFDQAASPLTSRRASRSRRQGPQPLALRMRGLGPQLSPSALRPAAVAAVTLRWPKHNTFMKNLQKRLLCLNFHYPCAQRPCLVHPKNQKLFKIFRHIESCGTYMKHKIQTKIKTNYTVYL